MNRMTAIVALVLLVGISTRGLADFPIRQGANSDGLPCIAYNSVDHEYLVVWAEVVPMGNFWVYSIVGQRLTEDGSVLGNPFTIHPIGVNPAVAYSSMYNSYVVAGNPGGGFVCQRVSNTGTLLGSFYTLMNGVNSVRILYNSISYHFLVLGAALVETPAGSGYYNIRIYSNTFTDDGNPLGSPLLVEESAHGYMPDEPAFGGAYAPVQSPETPYGRYLLAVGRGMSLIMLDSDGAPMDVVYDPAHPGVRYRYVPFTPGSPSGGEFHVDVAYGPQSGYSMTGKAFLVTWSDQNNTWQGSPWSGIWGGFVDAANINYSSTDDVPNNAFPISAIADHWTSDADVESWRPRASFNPSSQKFFVVWRETPGNNPLNNTNVKHIRGSYVYEKVPATNVIISSTSGAEDPKYPAVAASMTSEMALVAWQDYRNGGISNWDIYGSIQKVADPVEPTTKLMVTNTLDSGPGSLRQAILDANARSGKDTITFDIPGTEIHTITPATPLPTLTGPVLIDGYTQPGSRENRNALHLPCDAELKVVIDGTTLRIASLDGDGLHVAGGNSCVRGLVINSFPGAGIVLDNSGGNVVEGNYIGTDAWGSARRANFDGLLVDNASSNIVGGPTAAARNVISGNTGSGVMIEHAGASGNRIQGNYVGVNAAGNAALRNDGAGIWIYEAPSNTVGGSGVGEGNLIGGSGYDEGGSWSRGYGIAIRGDTATGNLVAGNLIGTNAQGDAPLTNNEEGVSLGGRGNTIGGTTPGSRNIISGNALEGIVFEGDSNLVQGNFIGTDITGAKAVANYSGVQFYGGSRNVLGGHTQTAGNLISGNAQWGVTIINRATENRVEGNWIGIQADGTSPLGNTNDGVYITLLAGHNIIGGTADGVGNVIAFNGGVGVRMSWDTTGNRICRNSIYANGLLGIDLVGGVEDSKGVTANDPGDADMGPNDLQNYPVLTAGEGGDFLSLTGTLNSKPNSTYVLEFFTTLPDNPASNGEGQTFLGWIEVTTDAAGDAPFSLTIGAPVAGGQLITATATDASGSTSEFSAPLIATATGLASGEGLPTRNELMQNYPNPFNPSTTIRYALPVRSYVTLTIFNALGERVGELVNGEVEAGYHEVQLDAGGLASGVYLCRIRVHGSGSASSRTPGGGVGDFVQTRKLTLVR